MVEAFLNRYNEELAALRRRAARFAEAFPKIAGRLRISGEVADDPHVERLIESFAYSSARIRQKLDDEFPELTGSLLETLYPHYLAPVPSMSVVRFTPSESLAGISIVPRHTEVVAEPIDGESCRFRTTQDVEIAPIELVAARMTGQPIQAPLSRFGAAACLELSLRCRGERATFGDLGLKRLRFYISAPWRQATALYELLLNKTLGLALARHPDDDKPIFLPKEQLKAVGFDEDQSMLPYQPTSFVGYRLLTEFFALPQKFLFFDIGGVERWSGNAMRVYVYLAESDTKLERSVSARDFTLHATPIVNLFRQQAEPLVVDGRRTEYRLLPDARRQQTREIYSVEKIVLNDRRGNESISRPFFGNLNGRGAILSWQLRRLFNPEDDTSDIEIAFVEVGAPGIEHGEYVASIDTLCLNRNLPEKLPFGGGHPHLQMETNSDAVDKVDVLIPPTSSVRLSGEEGRHWRLISHLLLNHLSVTDGGGAALRDILTLYAFKDTPETRQMINAIAHVEGRSSVARLGSGGIVPGTDIFLEFDPATLDRPTAYLFSAVLDRFFGLYTSVNSFSRLKVTIRGQTTPIASWPPRSAERPLL